MLLFRTFKNMHMYLKSFLCCLLSGSLFLLPACKQQDQKLIGKVEAEITARQSDLGHYESVGASLEKLQRELEVSIPSLENAPADSLKIKANIMVNKEKSALAEYKDGLLNLTKRLAEYRAGTVDQKALELEYAVASKSLGNMKKTFTTLENQDLYLREEMAQRLKKQEGR